MGVTEQYFMVSAPCAVPYAANFTLNCILYPTCLIGFQN